MTAPTKPFDSGAPTGWTFVVAAKAAQIAAGATTEEAYARWFDDSGLIDGFLDFVRWTDEHPGETPPPEINTIQKPKHRDLRSWRGVDHEA